MAESHWYKQSKNEPLYPDLLWSRPENKQHSGKLLIVGGNSAGFTKVANAYSIAEKTGAGSIRVILPDTLQKIVGKIFPSSEFVSSTPSGSIAREALAQIIEASHWADGTLIIGDLGHNSESAVLLESFVRSDNYSRQLVLANDAIDNFMLQPELLLQRKNTTLILSLQQLQRLTKTENLRWPLTTTMDLTHLIDVLHDLSDKYAAYMVTYHFDQLLVAATGKVSVTKSERPLLTWQVEISSRIATWWLQNPSKGFEALTTAALGE